MKELSKQDVEVVLAGKGLPGELLVGESLAKYFARLYLATKDSRDEQLSQRDAQIAALTAENVTLKASRETLANNSLEACNEIYCAGYRNTALYDGLKKSTGDRNTYPNPIRVMVDEATKQLQTPATDAAANALRAEGVNHAGKTVMAMLNHQDKGVGRALEVMAQVEMNYIKPVGGSVADGN